MVGSPSLLEEARAIVDAFRSKDMPVRVVGGIAISLRSPPDSAGLLEREYGDIDLCGLSARLPRYESVFESLGFESVRPFNVVNASSYLRFDAEDRGLHVDLFIDQLEMCHTLQLRNRLQADAYTLSLSDLLLSKLQIVQLTEKDVTDVLRLLAAHDIVERSDESGIDLERVLDVCGGDWGWYRTVTMNIERCSSALPKYLPGGVQQVVANRLQRLARAIEETPKTLRWKLRSKVGERVRWYEMPEDPTRPEERRPADRRLAP